MAYACALDDCYREDTVGLGSGASHRYLLVLPSIPQEYQPPHCLCYMIFGHPASMGRSSTKISTSDVEHFDQAHKEDVRLDEEDSTTRELGGRDT